jgi:calcineurin-like phosphoesterase family protein
MSLTAPISEVERDSPRQLESQNQHEPQQEKSPSQTRYSFMKNLLSSLRVKEGEVYEANYDRKPRWYRRLVDAGVEENGIKPVPLEQRISTRYSNLFTVFFTCLLCLLP